MNTYTKEKLSRLMKMSWDIQEGKRSTRAKALRAAWAIMANEDITINYLVRKINPLKAAPEKAAKELGLFRFSYLMPLPV